ncbi:ribonuclease HII [Desulfofundulus thermosubterraneus]|uniref:Ribonuclease HII n=1 Tax=Desulfofundulus thermosubterraneus DSM 16057 TaxID=1121432 RepID=A0A1M6KV84_9FIRM|nr:ribonuclease HII [Desulfofundulus thermosubterraneus]SHJ62829.1 RNase HII [Desulfofundulus thermosubterraneus DSM 16057]
MDNLDNWFRYEEELLRQGYSLVAGVDEAGRGPLAGPVVAAAVILPGRVFLPGLNDSKKISPGRREDLAHRIKQVALDWAIGISTVNEIELLNIHYASLLAMRRAVRSLAVAPQFLLVDGRFPLNLSLPQRALVDGDASCASIAAASILAKVTRDQLMQVCHHLYPQYGFDRHKGYPTSAHRQALVRWGPCPLHRPSFRGVR